MEIYLINYRLNDNVFREGVTVNPGTEGGGMLTKIENNCLIMVLIIKYTIVFMLGLFCCE